MPGIKTADANSILDSHLSGTMYLALFTTAPTASAAGTEVSGGSYARQAITFAAAASGSKASNALINFPSATASWGTVVAWAICTASSGGSQRAFRAISSLTVNNGDQVSVPSGNIVVTLS